MAFSKARYFNGTLFDQSLWSKALAHPARIIILTHLLEHGITSFAILNKKIPLARTTVSQHIRILRQLGLIQAREKFPHTYYKLNRNICHELAERIKPLQLSFCAKKYSIKLS